MTEQEKAKLEMHLNNLFLMSNQAMAPKIDHANCDKAKDELSAFIEHIYNEKNQKPKE